MPLKFLNTYVITIVTFFLVFSIAVLYPPLQIPDESAHWITAARRLERLLNFTTYSENYFCSGSKSLIAVFDSENIHFNYENKVPTNILKRMDNYKEFCVDTELFYGNVLSYPQVLLARLILPSFDKNSSSAYSAFLLSRLFGGGLICFFLFYPLLKSKFRFSTSLAIRVIILLTPIGLQQTVGVSTDLTSIILAIAVCNFCEYFAKLPLWFDVLQIIMIITALATKPVLFPIVLIPFVSHTLYAKKESEFFNLFLKNNLKKYILLISFIVSSLIGSFLAYQNKYRLLFPYPLKSNSKEQLSEIISHPIRLFNVVFFELFRFENYEGFFTKLGWLDFSVSKTAFVCWCLLSAGILFSCISRHEKKAKTRVVNNNTRFGKVDIFFVTIVLLLSLSSAFLVSIYTYITWTSVGSNVVEGFQSRYLLPSMIAMSVLSQNISTNYNASPIKSSFMKYNKFILFVIFVSGLVYLSEIHYAITLRYN